MWFKLIFNGAGVLSALAIAVVYLADWGAGLAHADWFVWLGFAIFLYRCLVDCFTDVVEAIADIQRRRRRRAYYDRVMNDTERG